MTSEPLGPHAPDPGTAEQLTVPWSHRISTRLTLLLLAVVAVLAVATGVLLWRALAAIVRLRTGVDLDAAGAVAPEGLADAIASQIAIDQEAAGAILRSTLVNLAVVVAVTLVAATAFSRSLLVDPIRRLTAATHALTAGDRGVRTGSTDRSELGELARSFDSMADALQSAQDRLEARVAARTAELRALLELSNTVALTTDLQPQLEAVLARMVDTGDAVAAEVLELEADGRLTRVASLGTVPERQLSLRGEDAGRRGPKGLTAMAATAVVDDDVLALPLRARGEVVGVLHAFAPAGTGWDDERLDLAGGLAAQAAVAIENSRLYERAREQAADEERQHLARELHDSVSQAIYAVVLTSHALRKRLPDDPQGAAEAVESVIELAEGALAEMRALIFELRPEALAEVGLVGALQRQLDGLELRHGLNTESDFHDEPDIAFTAKQVLLRVVQEALHNVAKHAHAKKVKVSLRQHGEALALTVTDDGVGFDVNASYPGHLGLTSMHERVAALGGELQVTSEPGHGTTVSLSLPLGVAGSEERGGARSGEVRSAGSEVDGS